MPFSRLPLLSGSPGLQTVDGAVHHALALQHVLAGERRRRHLDLKWPPPFTSALALCISGAISTTHRIVVSNVHSTLVQHLLEPIQPTVIYRFLQMWGQYICGLFQISNGPGYFEDAV